MPTPQQQQYLQLRQKGYTEDEAAQQVMQGYYAEFPKEEPQQPQQKPSWWDAFVASGGNQAGFGDEIAGAISATFPPDKAAADQSWWDRYQQAKQGSKEFIQQQTAGHPTAVIAGQALGAPIAAALAGPGAIGGVTYGLLNAAGRIDVDSPPEDAAMIATSEPVIGALGAKAGEAVGAGLGWAGKKVLGLVAPNRVGAGELANRINPDEMSQIGSNRTIGEQTSRSAELENQYPVRFTPSQSTGSSEAALVEQTAGTMKEPAKRLSLFKNKQLSDAEQALKMAAEDVAANPKRLGKEAVSDDLVDKLQRHIDDLFKERSARGQANYAIAEQLAGDTKFATKQTEQAIQTELERLPANAGSTRAMLEKTLNDLKNGAPLKKLRIEQKDWGSRAADYAATTTEGRMASGEERALATRVAKSIQGDLDAAAENGGAAYSKALKTANDAWHADSQAIEDASPELVNTILKKGATDAGDTLTDKVLKASPEQLRGIFKILNKTAPETAADVRAQMLLDTAQKHGAAQYGTELGKGYASRLRPAAGYNFLQDNAAKFEAAYAGDPQAQLRLRDTLDILERLGSDVKGVPGAQGVLGTAAQAGASVAGGVTGRGVLRTFQAILHNERLMAKAISTPEGLELFNKLARAAKDGTKLDEAAMKLMGQQAIRLGWMDALNEERKLEEKATTAFRGASVD